MKQDYIVGLGALDRQLAEVQLMFDGAMLQNMLSEAADIMQRELQAAAPVDTGVLRDSIVVTRISRSDTAARVDVSVGATGWYWRFSEFGTTHEPAQHWIRRAVERMKPRMNAQILDRALKASQKI